MKIKKILVMFLVAIFLTSLFSPVTVDAKSPKISGVEFTRTSSKKVKVCFKKIKSAKRYKIKYTYTNTKGKKITKYVTKTPSKFKKSGKSKLYLSLSLSSKNKKAKVYVTYSTKSKGNNFKPYSKGKSLKTEKKTEEKTTEEKTTEKSTEGGTTEEEKPTVCQHVWVDATESVLVDEWKCDGCSFTGTKDEVSQHFRAANAWLNEHVDEIAEAYASANGCTVDDFWANYNTSGWVYAYSYMDSYSPYNGACASMTSTTTGKKITVQVPCKKCSKCGIKQ